MAKRTKSLDAEAVALLVSELPDVEVGIACAGTSLEKRTLKTRGKAFLFLGPADIMLKLGDSLPVARPRATEHPELIKAGSGGWVTIRYEAIPKALTRKQLLVWITESYGLFAGSGRGTRGSK